jgi:hypothetical protein
MATMTMTDFYDSSHEILVMAFGVVHGWMASCSRVDGACSRVMAPRRSSIDGFGWN